MELLSGVGGDEVVAELAETPVELKLRERPQNGRFPHRHCTHPRTTTAPEHKLDAQDYVYTLHSHYYL